VIYRKFITWGAIKQGPKWSILGPFLKQGMAVSLRTVAVVGVIMASTSVLARVNAVSQAAHEIIRQVWILLVQFVECVNISNQAIVASAFGSKDLKYALEIVKRHMAYAVIIVSTATLTLMFFKLPLLRCFTGDAAVVGMAARVFPLVALSFPFDAITSVLDGTLTAAGQATWTARSTTFVSLAVLVALLSVERVMTMSLLKVWVFLKLITFSRLPILLHRVFRSTHSPFRGSLVVEQTRALTIEKNSAEESAAQNHGAAHEGSIGTQPEGAECAQSS
jgi:Na+-driven multidrug efflux pump